MIGARLWTYIKAKISLSLCLVVCYVFVYTWWIRWIYWWQKLRNTISRCWYQFYTKNKNKKQVRLRQVALVNRIPSRIGHATSEREPRKFHELLEHSFPPFFFFFPSNGLCVVIPGEHIALEVLSSYSPWHFSYHLAFFYLFYLFGFSFKLPFIFFFFFLSAFVFFNTSTQRFYIYFFSLGLL